MLNKKETKFVTKTKVERVLGTDKSKKIRMKSKLNAYRKTTVHRATNEVLDLVKALSISLSSAGLYGIMTSGQYINIHVPLFVAGSVLMLINSLYRIYMTVLFQDSG